MEMIGQLNAVAEVATEPTMTPGLFFHGSPQSALERFESQWDVTGSGRRGIYFTSLPDYALVYAFGREREWLNGNYGRLYSVELNTRNPLLVPKDCWDEYWGKEELSSEKHGLNELALELDAIAKGHDCIVTAETDGHIFEVIVLDPSAIRLRTPPGAPMPDATRALKSGIFFAVEDAPAPDHAPDATVLFASRRRAHEAGGAVRQVVVETNRSFYCDAGVWPELNLDEDLFIDGRIINCLVDPATGDALFHGDEPPVVLNRAARRSYLKEKKRRR